MDPSANGFYEFGPFRLDATERLLLRDGQALTLTPKAFDTLLLLVENSGHVLTKEELIARLWPDTFVEEANLTNNISVLRKALSEATNGQRYIETVPRRGYRFVVPVMEWQDEDLESLRQELESKNPGKATANIAAISETPTPRFQLRRNVWIVTLASVALVSIGVLALSLRSPSEQPKVAYTQITSDGQLKLSNHLYTDGSRLYFSEFVDEKLILAQVSVDGGETVPIPTSLPNPVLCDISPNGSELLVSSGRPPCPLWIVPLPGGSPRRLSNTDMMDARWSPDGQWLAYEQGRDLYLAKSDASEPRKLVTVPGDFDGWTAWSPDGSRLRFTVSDPTTYAYSLWEVAADATNLHPLLPGWNNPAAEGAGKWTSDGKYFLFEATRNGRTDIWAISEKGSLFQKASSEPVQLTAGPISFHHPVSSKDGRKVFAIGQMDRSEILRLNNAGEWVPYLSGISADGVSFSRDGNWVTYTLYPQGTLWRSKVDGSQRQQLTFPPMQANHPTWSPDGKRIAFMASVSRSFWNIYLVSAEGGTPQRLIPEDLIQADPDWSPDGTRLAFGASPYIYAGQPSVSQVIHVLDLRTNQVSTLPGSDGLWFPRWSPDGRYIAAIGRDLHQLMLFDITTGRSVELARNIYHFPHWSPDGQYVHIETWGEETRDATGATGPNPEPAMIRIRISDHKVERLVNLKPFRRLSDPRCWSGIAPDGSYLVLRNLRTQEIYSFDLK